MGLAALALSLGFGSSAVDAATGLSPGANAIQEHAQLASGRELYLRYCATCHGNSGNSDGLSAKNMKAKPTRLNGKGKLKMGTTQESIFQAITVGIPNSAMTSFDHLPVEERKAMASFVASMIEAGRPKTKAKTKASP